MGTVDSPGQHWLLVTLCIAGSVWAGIRTMLPHKEVDVSGTASPIVGFLCRESEVADVVMLAAMAAMFAYPAGPVGVWRAIFIGIGLAYVARLVAARSRPGGLSGERVAAGCYHILGAVAMFYATLSSGHANHAAAAHITLGSGRSPVPVLGWVFVSVFALDALTVAALVIVAPERFHLSRPRFIAAAIPHAIADFAMIAMLYGALANGAMSMGAGAIFLPA
jgi:hypothetical protein